MSVRLAAALAAALAATAVQAIADSPDRPLEFAPRLVAAINGKNLDRRKALLHPKTLACITPQTQPFIEDSLADQFRYNIPASHRSRFEAIPADRPLSVADGVTFPLRPTHQVQIDWETGPQQGVTFVALVAYTENGWREVWPCVSPEKVPSMQAVREARRQREQRVQSLAANMPQALRAEVTHLVAEGRKIDAIKRYQGASGEDLSTSKSVVELITPK
jgi:hypothetical protein